MRYRMHVLPMLFVVVALFIVLGSSVAMATATCPALVTCPVGATSIKPEDFHGQQGLDCEGTDTADDTSCWQCALQCATIESGAVDRFGAVEAKNGGTYYISDTLVVNNTYEGVIDGRGATLTWRGGYDTDESIAPPMWLLKDTSRLKIENMEIRSGPPWLSPNYYRLSTAFAFINVAGGTAPRGNILEHITTQGIAPDGMDYAVRFAIEALGETGLNENNDQGTINHCTFYNMSRVAVRIDHPQSLGHRIIATDAQSAACYPPGTTDHCPEGEPGQQGTSFVFMPNAVGPFPQGSGSFISIGGSLTGFTDAVFNFASIGHNVIIIDPDVETARRLIRTQGGFSTAKMPVQVIGGRYAIDKLADDGNGEGYFIKFERRGPLEISGLALDGTNPNGLKPRIYFAPVPAADSQLIVRDVLFGNDGSNDPNSDHIILGSQSRLISEGNLCKQAGGGVVPCGRKAAGVRGDYGMDFDQLSAVSLPNGHITYCTNCVPLSTPCQGGGTGSFATRYNGAWECGGGAALTYDAELDSVAEFNARLQDDDFLVVTGQGNIQNKDLTAGTNTFPTTGVIGYWATNPSRTSTNYCSPIGNSCASTESDVSVAMPAARARTLACRASAAPGNGKSWTLSPRAGGVDLTPSCVISGSGTPAICTATINSPSPWTEGAQVSLKVVPSGTPASATITCSLGIRP